MRRTYGIAKAVALAIPVFSFVALGSVMLLALLAYDGWRSRKA